MARDNTRDVTSMIRLGATLLAILVLVLFIAFNFNTVEIDLLLGTQSIRLAFALIFASVLGFLAGFLLPKRS